VVVRSGWSVVFLVAAELLVWSGVAKLLRPEATVAALRALRLPAGRWWARTLGTVELATGVLCLAVPSRVLALLLSGLYLAFAGFIVGSLTGVIRTTDCGCFGSGGSPPSWLHLGMNLVAAAAGFGVAFMPPMPDPARFVAATPIQGAVLVVGLATAGYLAVMVATKLPDLASSFRPSGSS
jgi:hypothetical protein